jgi:hypothetical protein
VVLQWLGGGATTVALTVWAVVRYWLRHERVERKRRFLLRAGAACLVASVGIVLWLRSVVWEYCDDCTLRKQIAIIFPPDNSEVGERVLVIGAATPHRVCRFVNMWVQDLSPHADAAADRPGHWRPADITQVDGGGKWSAAFAVPYVTPRGKFHVRAYLSAKPILLSPDAVAQPVMDGLPSSDLNLRRQ